MYIEQKTAQKVFIAATLILAAVIIANPYTAITPMQGLVFIFFIFFIHSNIEKRFIIKQFSMKTEEQNKLLESIYRCCPDSISYKDYNFKYQLVNDVLSGDICNKNKFDIVNKTCYELFPKNIADLIRKKDKEAIETGNSVTYEVKLPVNNKELTFQVTTVPVIKDSDIIGILTIGRDITKNEHLKKTLHNKHRQLTTLLNTLPMVAYLKNTESDYIIGNFSPENSDMQKYRLKNKKSSYWWLTVVTRGDIIIHVVSKDRGTFRYT